MLLNIKREELSIKRLLEIHFSELIVLIDDFRRTDEVLKELKVAFVLIEIRFLVLPAFHLL